MTSTRVAKLTAILRKKGLDAFLISNPLNIYYISGFKSDTSSALITRHNNFIITDFRYKEDAQEINNFQLKLIKTGFKDSLKEVLKDLGVRRLGFEADSISYSRVNLLKETLRPCRIGLKPLSGTIENLRLFKDDSEIKDIKMAIAIAKKTLTALKNKIKPGITEKEVSLELDNLIRSFGGDKNAFETIVASGRNSSRPHAVVTNKIIDRGEHVLIDFGVSLNLYNCDLTRVFFLDKIKKLCYDIYLICKKAQESAIKKVKPGVRIRDIDKAARDYINKRGYGKSFGHSLGHGIGLSVHELPRIYPKNNQQLKLNMVFSIEPGIYIEGVGGVRIEDMVLVTKKGCEVLTHDIPK